MKIPNIFTERKEIIYFLLSVLFCAILFVFIYNPLGEVKWWNLPSPWDKRLYTAILVSIGFVLLSLSRFVLYFIQKRNHLTLPFYVLWGLGELVVYVLFLSISSFAISNGEIPFLLLSCRALLDIFAVLVVPYVIVFLMFIIREKNREISELSLQVGSSSSAESIQDNMTYVEQSIVQAATSESLNFYDRSGRFVFATRASNVLYVESADNYCNIHYINDNHEDFFILHNSMKNVNEAYADKGLLRCHRCYMVNVDKVKLVKKVKDGLVLELTDTDKVVPVSKTYNDIVVKYFVK